MGSLSIRIRPSIKSDAYLYSRYACIEDRVECMASFGYTPFEAAKYSIRVSEKVQSIFVNGELVCLVGVTRHSTLSNRGSIWMLCTTHVQKYPLVFMKEARHVVMDMMRGFAKVDNHVDARNLRMVRVLRFLGFEVQDPSPFGILRRPFHYFFREAICASQQ